MLCVVYDTLMWSWNLNKEKVKGILHILHDMLESVLVTNELAMKVSGLIVHYSPLFPVQRVSGGEDHSPACLTTKQERGKH